MCVRLSILPNRRGAETLDSSGWTWGLCLIVLTTAIHSLGIVLMSILGLRIRAGLKRRRVAFWHGVAILTGLIAAIGLSLAVLPRCGRWPISGWARSTTLPRQCFSPSIR